MVNRRGIFSPSVYINYTAVVNFYTTKRSVCVCAFVWVCMQASGPVATSERPAVWSRQRRVPVRLWVLAITCVPLAADWLYLSPPATITVQLCSTVVTPFIETDWGTTLRCLWSPTYDVCMCDCSYSSFHMNTHIPAGAHIVSHAGDCVWHVGCEQSSRRL